MAIPFKSCEEGGECLCISAAQIIIYLAYCCIFFHSESVKCNKNKLGMLQDMMEF
jgi:hypothetical protein